MGNSLKDELERIDILSKTHNAIMDALLPKVSDPYENMDPGERDEHERAMARSELDAAFERLGLHEKLESIKPDLDLCKCLMTLPPPLRMDEGLVLALKLVIEFIECLDEPQ